MNKFLFGVWVFCYSVLAHAQVASTTSSVSFSSQNGAVNMIGYNIPQKSCMAALSQYDIVNLHDVVAIHRDPTDVHLVRVQIAGYRDRDGYWYIDVKASDREQYIKNILKDQKNCR